LPLYQKEKLGRNVKQVPNILQDDASKLIKILPKPCDQAYKQSKEDRPGKI
jgi:hypothetical protein